MTIAKLKEDIASQKKDDAVEIEERFWNTAIDFCLKMIDVYAKYREPESNDNDNK